MSDRSVRSVRSDRSHSLCSPAAAAATSEHKAAMGDWLRVSALSGREACSTWLRGRCSGGPPVPMHRNVRQPLSQP